MNTAFPPQVFASDHTAIDGLIDLFRSGFENPEGIGGSVSVSVPEYPERAFIAHFEQDLRIEPGSNPESTDTQVSIPVRTIHRIFNEFEFLDWRDPEIIGTIHFSGNLALANHIAKSCLRPNDWTEARFRRIGRQHASRNYRALTHIEYLHKPTQRQLLEAMAESMPVVVTGIAPSTSTYWTIEKLAENYGDAIVRVRSATHQQSMAEFVDELRTFEDDPDQQLIEGFTKPYTEGAALPEAMWSDFGPLYFYADDFIAPQLWLGAVPVHIPTSSLHRDPLTGFLSQVIGRKRLDLYSADQEELLYPYKSYNNYQPCWFKPESPDYNVYPKAEQARCLSVELKPGELLVVRQRDNLGFSETDCARRERHSRRSDCVGLA